MTLQELNQVSPSESYKALMLCCGCERWAEAMNAERPFESVGALQRQAERVWQSLSQTDWLEAFSKHPKIGGQSESAWSIEEQSGMSRASDSIADSLKRLNEEYEAKFGWIYIVCATGRSAEEMLSLLESRLPNDPDDEIRIAAAEQAKIMHLRLEKLLAQ